MKKYMLIAGLLAIILLLAVLYLKPFGKDEQKTIKPQTTIEEDSSKDKSNDVDNLAINYTLSDNTHVLKIRNENGIYIKNTNFSTPDNVTIVFNDTDFDMSNLPVSNMMVVPIDYVKNRTSKLKLGAEYADYIQEFMAFNSSTQCSILKPEDFKKEKIADYSVWVAHRTDKCTFRVEKPFIQVINMYGFETNGYVVVLSANGHKEEVPQNVDELIRKVISLTTIE